MIVRRATAEDIAAFSSLKGKPTMLAWVGDDNGRLVVLGGLAFSQGRWFGFCDLTDEARRHKFAVARTAKRVLREAQTRGIRFVYAERDQHEPRALAWLTSLGFTLDPRSQRLYRWSAEERT